MCRARFINSGENPKCFVLLEFVPQNIEKDPEGQGAHKFFTDPIIITRDKTGIGANRLKLDVAKMDIRHNLR